MKAVPCSLGAALLLFSVNAGASTFFKASLLGVGNTGEFDETVSPSISVGRTLNAQSAMSLELQFHRFDQQRVAYNVDAQMPTALLNYHHRLHQWRDWRLEMIGGLGISPAQYQLSATTGDNDGIFVFHLGGAAARPLSDHWQLAASVRVQRYDEFDREDGLQYDLGTPVMFGLGLIWRP